jgi:hypothetical protein
MAPGKGYDKDWQISLSAKYQEVGIFGSAQIRVL